MNTFIIVYYYCLTEHPHYHDCIYGFREKEMIRTQSMQTATGARR